MLTRVTAGHVQLHDTGRAREVFHFYNAGLRHSSEMIIGGAVCVCVLVQVCVSGCVKCPLFFI